jgi:secreted trypsin-like serine protease
VFAVALLATVLAVGVVPAAPSSADEPHPVSEESAPDGRIVGGTVASLGEYPYQALVFPGPFLCGGSIIHPRWIATAAHCMFPGGTTPFDPSDILVVVGTNLASTGGDALVPDDVIVHPSYNPLLDGAPNDIALLHLPREVHESFVPLARPGQESLWAAGTNSVVTGWGLTAEDGFASEQLREVTVPITTDAGCTTAYGSAFVASSMICAGLPGGGKDSCQGDSGGPLVVQGGEQRLQMSIVSWGVGCARPGLPGVYTRLANFFTFVKSHVGAPPNDNFASAETPPCAVSFDAEANQFATIQASEPNAE